MPVVNLDDFYKNGDDPTLPRIEPRPGPGHRRLGRPGLLVAARTRSTPSSGSATTVRADIPVYDISRDGRVGSTSAGRCGGAPYVVAEGLFAQEVVRGCRERGLLADAVCVRNHRLRSPSGGG